jgi:DNA-binding protein HU-beta
MTKNELIGLVSAETGVSKVQVEKVLNEIIYTVIYSLREESRFPLYGLGIFEIVRRPKRNGRNPRTGKAITIKPKNMVKFRASKLFKDTVNAKK